MAADFRDGQDGKRLGLLKIVAGLTAQLAGRPIDADLDAWYRANGVTKVRPPKAGSSPDSFVGSELDFTATWKPTKNFALQAGYSHFFAGSYLSDAGSKKSDDADFAYMQVQIDF